MKQESYTCLGVYQRVHSSEQSDWARGVNVLLMVANRDSSHFFVLFLVYE